MHPIQSICKVSFFTLIVLLAASCSTKSKKEQLATDVDSTSQAIAKTEAPKPKDSVVEKSVEKKEIKPVAPKKNTPIVPTKVEEKKEVAKEPAKEPIKEAAPVKEPGVVTPPVKGPEKKVEPQKVDSSTLKKPTGKPYYFKVVSKEDGKEIFGNLQLQEAAAATRFQVVKSGEIVYLDEPRNKRGAYTIAALLPGYRQSSLVFGYFNPPIVTGSKGEEIITLTLDKARTGDYIDFNNVHFFQNTSIMRPVSQAELDELVNLLKGNLKYKIKVYGYCNGTQERESYTMGTSANFFAMDPTTNKKETISSKELSEARAENVKAYLVKQGVDASRISIKGEGGKVPLYPESGTLAQYNDRIEVEFIKN